MEKRDWAAIKSEYVTGRESLQKLADKHKIPLRTIKDRCKKEKWVEGRNDFRAGVVQKTAQKVMKKEAKRLAKLRGVAEQMADLIAADVERLERMRSRSGILTKDDIQMLKDLSITLKNVADIMRDVYDIPNIREKLLIDKYKDYKKAAKEAEQNEGGVIMLSEILEEEASEQSNMREGDTDGETDSVEAPAEAD